MHPKKRADFVRPYFCVIYNVCTTNEVTVSSERLANSSLFSSPRNLCSRSNSIPCLDGKGKVPTPQQITPQSHE
ncbi:hypothetical protein GG496_000223 [Candidatus Fervidibacteria bacterium JGI MDM2 JNZ-1-D12]